MTIHYYSDTSVGAPVLDGLGGSLIQVLDYCLVTKMGWIKARSATNKATYKAPTGNAKYLGVDDTLGADAQLRLYETLPDNAGVDNDVDFGAVGGPYFIRKSNLNNDHVRNWVLVSDGKLFHLWTGAAGYQASDYGPSLTTFGEFYSRIPLDMFNTVLMCGYELGAANFQANKATALGDGTPGNALLRAWNQNPGAAACGKRTLDPWNANVIGGANHPIYPGNPEQALLTSRIFVLESGATIRGRLQGVLAPLHDRPFTHGDTFTGSGELAGRTFVALNLGSNGWFVPGQILLETSDTWGT